MSNIIDLDQVATKELTQEEIVSIISKMLKTVEELVKSLNENMKPYEINENSPLLFKADVH